MEKTNIEDISRIKPYNKTLCAFFGAVKIRFTSLIVYLKAFLPIPLYKL